MSIFDQPIERRASDSIKWGKYAGRDILPLWVADMDFAAPPAVIDALQQRIAHGVFGYGHPWPSLTESVLAHLEGEYDWAIEPEWIVWLPGLVTGLNVACRAVDGEVLTATPIYPPFLSAPRFSGRKLNRVELACSDGRWQWDKSALQNALTAATKLFLLCHPHNPVGRCWNEEELRDLAAFAEENDLIVCSDEIHCGLILDADKRHIPFASLSPDAAKRSITLMAPSKTYNIPGLGCAFAVIPDAALRRRFLRAMDGIVPHVNVLGLAACEAAYRDCGDMARRTDRLSSWQSRPGGCRGQRRKKGKNEPRRGHLSGLDRRSRTRPAQSGGPFRSAWTGPVRWRRFRRAGLAALQFRLYPRDAG